MLIKHARQAATTACMVQVCVFNEEYGFHQVTPVYNTTRDTQDRPVIDIRVPMFMPILPQVLV